MPLNRYPCQAVVVALSLLVSGCGGNSTSTTIYNPQTSLSITAVPASYLATPTYDGSGQATEPDVLFVPSGWSGFKYWMTAAPYRSGLAEDENASIWASNDTPGPGQKWVVPPGVKNPITGIPPRGFYYSDQSIFLDTDGTMYLYFSLTNKARKFIYGVSSKDGWKTVSPRKVLFTMLVAAANPLVSTVLRDPVSGRYYLWYADEAMIPPTLIRYTAQSPLGPFVKPVSCRVDGIPLYRLLWEQNIIQAPSSSKKLYGLITLADVGTAGASTSLVFMESTDEGLTWSLTRQSLLNPGNPGTWDDFEIYRATLQPSASTLAGEGNQYDIWYSGSNIHQVWHIAYASGTLSG